MIGARILQSMIVLGLAACLVVGCQRVDPAQGKEPGRPAPPPEFTVLHDEYDGTGNVYVFRDKFTGCEYLIFAHQVYKGGEGGMTARLGPDGRPRCHP